MAFVTTEDRGAVRVLTMSAPERKNAVPEDGWGDLTAALQAFAASPRRVLVIRGEGEDFCAGADLARRPVDRSSAADNAARMRRPSGAARALFDLAKPTVAAVDGVAVGAGMNLAIGCDIVVATTRARFAEIFVRRGLTVDFGGTWLLPRLVGLARAREMALTGRVVDSGEALAIGLVSRVVEPDDLEGTVMALAEELAAGAPLAQRFVKAALARSSSMSFDQALAFETHAQAVLLGSDDAAEGTQAFLERRPPNFQGK